MFDKATLKLFIRLLLRYICLKEGGLPDTMANEEGGACTKSMIKASEFINF